MIGSPSTLTWTHRAATKLHHLCRRWQLEGKGDFQGQEHSIVDATHPLRGQASPPVKLVCIADTHNSKPDLPDGDILLHAGDLSQYGTFDEVQAQLHWLNSQPHQHKILIAGNHDLLLDSEFVRSHPDRELDSRPGKRRADLDWGNIHYLQHDSMTVEVTVGTTSRLVRVFGSPWTPRMGSWAFQYGADSDFIWAATIPHDADVVLLHGPPAGHLDDDGKGCKVLLSELWRVRPRLAICGHIHAGRGHELLVYDRVQQYYEDVALGRRNRMLSLLLLGICTAWQALMHMERALGGTLSNNGKKEKHEQSTSTWLVNAAIAGGQGKNQKRDAYVVLI